MTESTTSSSHQQSWLAWLIVGFAFLALAISFSARAAIGMVMPIWEQEMGWSRSFVSGAVAAALLIMAAIAPFAGRLLDRHGVRATLSLGLLLVGIASLVIATASNRYVMLIALCGIGALGFGTVATHVVSAAIARLFSRHRGLALGIATSGATAGQFVILPLTAFIVATWNWRWGFVLLGIGALLLVPFLWRMLAPPENTTPKAEAASSFRADVAWILRQKAFHILFWSFLICGFTTTGVIETHFMSYAQFCGFTPMASAAAYGLLSAVNMVGMILAGWLTDRMNRVVLLGGIYLLRGATFLILTQIGADIETLLGFAVLFGAVDYATIPPTASLVASHLGLRVMGLAMGMLSTGHSIGGAAGAYFGGYIFDLMQRYDWMWFSATGLAVMAGLMVFLLGDRSPAGTGTGATAPA